MDTPDGSEADFDRNRKLPHPEELAFARPAMTIWPAGTRVIGIGFTSDESPANLHRRITEALNQFKL